MSDGRLRKLERVYQQDSTQRNLVRLTEERIRAGQIEEPARARALVGKPPVRCFIYTEELTSTENGAALVLEVPAVVVQRRPHPELGATWVFDLPLACGVALPFRGMHMAMVAFEDKETRARLAFRDVTPTLLTAAFILRFTWTLSDGPPPPAVEVEDRLTLT